MSGDFWRDTAKHYERLNRLDAELHGVITAALEMVDEGRISEKRALDIIREKHTQVAAATKVAWDEHAGGAR